MSVERRLQALEARRHHQPAPGRRLTVSEIDLVLATFEPSERQLSAAERTEAQRLLAICRTGLTEAELDAELAKFEPCPLFSEMELKPC